MAKSAGSDPKLGVRMDGRPRLRRENKAALQGNKMLTFKVEPELWLRLHEHRMIQRKTIMTIVSEALTSYIRSAPALEPENGRSARKPKHPERMAAKVELELWDQVHRFIEHQGVTLQTVMINSLEVYLETHTSGRK